MFIYESIMHISDHTRGMRQCGAEQKKGPRLESWPDFEADRQFTGTEVSKLNASKKIRAVWEKRVVFTTKPNLLVELPVNECKMQKDILKIDFATSVSASLDNSSIWFLKKFGSSLTRQGWCLVLHPAGILRWQPCQYLSQRFQILPPSQTLSGT
jgi:hypothetical protein